MNTQTKNNTKTVWLTLPSGAFFKQCTNGCAWLCVCVHVCARMHTCMCAFALKLSKITQSKQPKEQMLWWSALEMGKKMSYCLPWIISTNIYSKLNHFWGSAFFSSLFLLQHTSLKKAHTFYLKYKTVFPLWVQTTDTHAHILYMHVSKIFQSVLIFLTSTPLPHLQTSTGTTDMR